MQAADPLLQRWLQGLECRLALNEAIGLLSCSTLCASSSKSPSVMVFNSAFFIVGIMAVMAVDGLKVAMMPQQHCHRSRVTYAGKLVPWLIIDFFVALSAQYRQLTLSMLYLRTCLADYTQDVCSQQMLAGHMVYTICNSCCLLVSITNWELMLQGYKAIQYIFTQV